MAWGSLFNGPWRRAGLIAGLVLVGLLVGARVFLMTPMAHSLIESRSQALSVRGQTITLDRVHGDLFSGIRADRISIRDSDGVWVEAKQAHVSWRLFPMIFGHLDLRDIRAEGINVVRRPNLEPASAPSGAAPFDEYSIGNLSIAQLSLAQGVAGPAQTYQLVGRLEASGWRGNLHIDLIPTDGGGDEVQADIVWGGETLLDGEIDLTGAPNGLIAQVLGLPAGEGVTARLNASGGLLGGELVAQAQFGTDLVLDVEATADRRDYQASGRVDFSKFERFEGIAQRIGDELEFEASIDPDAGLTAYISAPTGIVHIAGDLSADEGERALENFVLDATGLDTPKLSGFSALNISELSASGRLSQFNRKVAFEGHLDAPALSYEGNQFGPVSSEGLIEFVSGTLSVGANLAFAPGDGFPASVKSALGQSIMGEVNANYSIPRSLLSIEAASLHGENLSAAGTGTLRLEGPIALTGSFGLQDVSFLKTVSGRIELNGDTLSDIELALDGTAQPLVTAPQLLQELAPKLSYKISATRRDAAIALNHAELKSDAISATISGDIAPNDIALTGRAEARFDGQIDGLEQPLGSQFSISGTPNAPGIALFLNGTYQDDPILAELRGQLQDGRFVLSELYGEWRLLVARGKGAIELAALPDSSLDLEINGRVPNLSDLKAKISYQGRELASHVSVTGFEAGETVVETAEAHLSGTWPKFEGEATYQASVPIVGAPQAFVGTYPLKLDAESRSMIVDGSTAIGSQTIAIQSPLLVSVDPTLQIEGVLAGFGGEIDLDFDNSGAEPSRLTFKEIALADLGAIIQRPGLIGTINGDVDVRLSERGPNGSASLRITDLSRAGLESARANLTADLQLTDGRLIADAAVVPSDGEVSLEASLSTELIDEGTIVSIRPLRGALTPIKLNGAGDIAPLWALAGLDMRLGGQFALDLSNGEGRTFGFSGLASLINGTFEDGITGIYLEAIETKLQLDPEAITVEQASARGARGGAITASGTYHFNGDSDLEANLSRLRALRRDDISTTLSGQARIERRDHRTHVEGDIQIDEMRIDLSKLPRAGYTVLDVQFAGDSETGPEQTATREAISLDLDLRADRRVFVDGPSFESEWGVDAKVGGSPGDPTLTGAATLVRGEANVIGQRFDLSDGRIQFAGSPSESELFLQADRTSDGVTTMITLSGEVADPEISFGSDPSLPEDEVLARVLFGRSPSNLSPLQAAQLASAAAQLAGGDAFSLTGELQDATGLDRLDFGLDDEGQATLSTGKYLADDVYLEIESGATGAPAVALEWTPLENIEVDAEVDPELGPKVAIQWKRDFDRLPGEPRND